MLGSTTCKMLAGDWNTCALGAAGNAVGLMKNFEFVFGGVRYEFDRRHELILKTWPWLEDAPNGLSRKDFDEIIFTKFDDKVCAGLRSLEWLIDYVVRVEPSCGECNRFECACTLAVVIEAKEGVLSCSTY
jgi:hypothetical protein